MRNTKPIVYMDACCFIDAVKSAAGFPVDGRVGDVWHIKKLFEAHRAGDITVQTSMLSLAECVAVESGQADVPPAAQTEIKRLLMSGQFVTLATMTPKTARITQDFRWKHKLVLKGCDALHVATAIEIGAREFISTDERLRKQIGRAHV